MLEEMRHAVREALESAGVSDIEVVFEHPADMVNGDYATGAAMRYAKQAGRSPRELADTIVAKLGDVRGVAKIEVAGPGFINVSLKPSVIWSALDAGRASGDEWGGTTSGKGRKIMVEYTDPNPFKEFHIGHLVPNALGESVARLLQFSGAEVKRANWQGDVGVHVAKSLFVLLEKNITNPTIADLAAAYPEGSRRYDEDPAAKAAIDVLNKTIYERSDVRVNDLYDKGRALSLEHFETIYKILGTKFDFYFFESVGGPRGIEVVRAHPDIFVESDGAVIFEGEKYGLHTRVFINRLGLPTYEAKEIGLAVLKREAYDFDLTITITGNEQKEYFRVVMKAMELALPELRGKLAFKTNGMLRFAEGKMSSRAGNIIRGDDLIADVASAAKERSSESRAENHEALAQKVAVGAIKFQILKGASGKDIIFDKERALSLEGDSGPYLQYAYARTCAIIEKAKASGVSASFDAAQETSELVRHVYRFPDIVAYAQEKLEPHLVATYLIELASYFNSWYAHEHILDGGALQSHKVAIVEIVGKTLKNGLWLLGIPAPEKM